MYNGGYIILSEKTASVLLTTPTGSAGNIITDGDVIEELTTSILSGKLLVLKGANTTDEGTVSTSTILSTVTATTSTGGLEGAGATGIILSDNIYLLYLILLEGQIHYRFFPLVQS